MHLVLPPYKLATYISRHLERFSSGILFNLQLFNRAAILQTSHSYLAPRCSDDQRAVSLRTTSALLNVLILLPFYHEPSQKYETLAKKNNSLICFLFCFAPLRSAHLKSDQSGRDASPRANTSNSLHYSRSSTQKPILLVNTHSLNHPLAQHFTSNSHAAQTQHTAPSCLSQLHIRLARLARIH